MNRETLNFLQKIYSYPTERIVLNISILLIFIIFFVELINIKSIGFHLFIISKIPIFILMKWDSFLFFPILWIISLFIYIFLKYKKQKINLKKFLVIYDSLIFYISLTFILFLYYLANKNNL